MSTHRLSASQVIARPIENPAAGDATLTFDGADAALATGPVGSGRASSAVR